jgi:hypothetical protein
MRQTAHAARAIFRGVQRETCFASGVMKICVYGCPGRQGEEEPHVFYLGARRLPVVAILDRWQETGHRYFEVTADDGRCFLLRHQPGSGHWELAAVYRSARVSPRRGKNGNGSVRPAT